jgi:ATP phosphoribosyltransferase regulatory subunit
MVYQPPTGARDLLPVDVAQKRWIEDRLQQVFHRWGYHRIITSTLERLDTLMAGGAIQRSTVIQLQGLEEETLGLRPELTASIARTAVTRITGTYPQRLYYNANVFRKAEEGSHSGQQEFYQAGVELLGSGGLVADAEILLLLLDCLNNLGLSQLGAPTSSMTPGWSLILGEAGLTRSLLSAFPVALREPVRHAIAHLDRITLETMPMAAEWRDRALRLLDLRGKPADVLQAVSQFDLDSTQRAAVNNLKSLLDLLQDSVTLQAGGNPDELPIVLDLSLIRTFDYYTGIVFEAVSATGQQTLGQGGRYDQLLGLYHPEGQSQPGIGFSLQIEQLHQVLLPTQQLPHQMPGSDWLVVSESPQSHAIAFAQAQILRAAQPSPIVEIDLSGQPRDAVRQSARDRRIAQIAWVAQDGTVVTENLPSS